ncbi:putative ABC transport system permease protein [Alteromonadaceae bacterium Bs31]|nr:putative ABC transport system permease protein [Alteromonadaceae bacterium Bs31]
MFAQIIAVIKMNLLSLPGRIGSSLTTLLAVAIVVTVLLAFMAMGEGFQKTMEGSGSDEVAIMLRGGSQAELNSGLEGDTLNIVSVAPGIAKNENGPIVSGELYVVVDGTKRSSQTEANLPLRGIGTAGFALRENIKLVEGRMFEPGKTEIIVGTSILSQFDGFELGKTLRFGTTEWTVVGVFDAGGSVFGSELLTDVRAVQTQFNRGNSYQSIRVKLEDEKALDKLKDYIANEPRLNLDVNTEKAYYSEQSKDMAILINMGWGLAIFMALGALAGALNTMYTSVESKAVEIATLRAIGYKTTAAFIGTLVESLVIAVLGGILGTLIAFLLFDGISTSTMGGSFTQVVFDFNVSANAFKNGIILAFFIGLVGGFFPALRAARLPVVLAFRS